MFVITDKCTACGLCLQECPIEAIEPGESRYSINETCCDFEECTAVCPEDAIVSEAELEEDRDA